MEYVFIVRWLLIICFLVSLWAYFKKHPDYPYLAFFPPILFITVVVEYIALYLVNIGKPNLLLYNFFSIFWACYYSYCISLMITNVKVKRIIWVTISIYFIVVLSKLIFIDNLPTMTFNAGPHSLGFLMIVIFCVYYFYELFKTPKYVNLKNNPAFWICSGLLFFCACGFPMWGFMNVWGKFPFIVRNFIFIQIILNVFLYSLFIIGFLCIRAPKYTLSSS